MGAASEVVEVAAMQAVSLMRTTDHQGEEHEWAGHELADLEPAAIAAIIKESRQSWMKFADGSAITITVYSLRA
ncbi:hypothetical protein [Candidatus Poriferisodalis sp.]|uniref:hypothetical protein n=1 Tax=Candidatus Poriferisodalis sp. TaxID=3101277 RepID=UPI003B025E96